MFRSVFSIVCSVFLCVLAWGTEPKRVALVFDDGPTPEQAVKLLAILEEAGVRVSFAQVANTMQQHVSTTLATRARGHEIVNHSFLHRDVESLSDAELEKEIGGAQRMMTEVLGEGPRWYWPPYLKITDRVREATAAAGVTLYEPSSIVVSKDYDNSVSADEIERLATKGVTDGAVILFHEWREETVERLPSILKTLKEQGCVFMTFSELADSMLTEAEQ
ncbi:Polysaccharide deacetylase domain protein [Verrucomicrobiia bacterium DG1235]|nr:Polysaccharide deacetylase domain protein [Verrucomicrobiae bacterium DG1235]